MRPTRSSMVFGWFSESLGFSRMVCPLPAVWQAWDWCGFDLTFPKRPCCSQNSVASVYLLLSRFSLTCGISGIHQKTSLATFFECVKPSKWQNTWNWSLLRSVRIQQCLSSEDCGHVVVFFILLRPGTRKVLTKCPRLQWSWEMEVGQLLVSGPGSLFKLVLLGVYLNSKWPTVP